MIAMRENWSARFSLPTWALLEGYEIEAECRFPFHLFLVRPGADLFVLDGVDGERTGLHQREERDLVFDLGASPSMMAVWEAVERDAARTGLVAPYV